MNLFSLTLALQKETVGHSANHPAVSCAEVLQNVQSPSGYYWLRSADGSVTYMYCDMTLTCKGVSGRWMQVVKLDMTNSSHQCPPGTRLRTDLPKRLCGIGISGVRAVHPPCLIHMELSTAMSVGRLLDIRTRLQMLLVKGSHKQLMVTILMASVSPMAEILVSTSGLLQHPSMK